MAVSLLTLRKFTKHCSRCPDPTCGCSGTGKGRVAEAFRLTLRKDEEKQQCTLAHGETGNAVHDGNCS